ncbi:MAG TPA: hypothetical protein VIV11_19975 [Kofleriaceae bacterium]
MRAAILLVLLAACVIETDEDTTPEPTYAEKAWLVEALPVFEASCMACHWNTTDTVGFLAGDTPWEIRQSLLDSGVVNVATPVSSRVLTKGAHTGPALLAVETSKILFWLVAERDARR